LNFRSKILSLETLSTWRESQREQGKKLAVTNGCFDLLHAGHVTYLEEARNQADALLVGVNGDAAVRLLKGPGRPLNRELDRASVLAALASVDAVCIFPEHTATRFLALARPDIYVKGGDYSVETLNPEERQTVVDAGGTIVIMSVVPGISTTSLVRKLSGHY
jgi:D-glycero-beta-D-manno-heptose 1-phosphate adenylyltransferase